MNNTELGLGLAHDNHLKEQSPISPPEASDTNSVEYASYETDNLKQTSERYTSITHTQTVDAHGRTIYRFDDKELTTPLEIVIFKNLNETLASVNQVVVPIKSFLSIHNMKFIKNELASDSTMQLRNQPIVNKGNVEAYTYDEDFVFYDTTIPLMMMAITVLADKYRPYVL